MNLTISIEPGIVERARQVAERQGKSLNGLIRGFLESVAGEANSKDLAAELRRLWREHPGHSGGRKFRREDAYEGRL